MNVSRRHFYYYGKLFIPILELILIGQISSQVIAESASGEVVFQSSQFVSLALTVIVFSGVSLLDLFDGKELGSMSHPFAPVAWSVITCICVSVVLVLCFAALAFLDQVESFALNCFTHFVVLCCVSMMMLATHWVLYVIEFVRYSMDYSSRKSNNVRTVNAPIENKYNKEVRRQRNRLENNDGQKR